MMTTRVLTGEAARLLDVSPDMVRYLERTGQLRASRIGHVRTFAREDVEALRLERERRTNNPRHRRDDVPGT